MEEDFSSFPAAVGIMFNLLNPFRRSGNSEDVKNGDILRDIQAKQTTADEKLANLDLYVRQHANEAKQVIAALQSIQTEQLQSAGRLSVLHTSSKVLQQNQKGVAQQLQRSMQAQTSSPIGLVANVVFSIPELLTAILENLSFGDLVRAESVNRKFRDVIRRSHDLQRLLWQEPRREGATEFLPLRCRLGLSIQKSRLSTQGQPGQQDTYEVRIIIRPCALRQTLEKSPRLLTMFVTQPPITEIDCQFKRDGYWGHERVVRNKDGLRVRDLIAAGQQVYRRYDDPGNSSDVRCLAAAHGKHDHCRMVEFVFYHTVGVPDNDADIKGVEIWLEEAALSRARPRGVCGPVLSVGGGPRREW